MKILYVSDAASVHTQRWAEFMRHHFKEVHVASFSKASIEGVFIHLLPQIPKNKLGYFAAIPKLRNLFKRIQPDIVHAQYVTSYGFLTALAKLKPYILTAWGTDVLISPKQSKFLNYCARYAIKHASALNSVAEHMSQAMYDLGALPNSIATFSFGVDCDFFVPDVNYIIGNPIRIISTRNFSAIYDVKTLISALYMLRQNSIDFKCKLIGDGPLRQELIEQVKVLNLNNCVEFLGHVPHQELRLHLASSDIFISSAKSDGNNVSLNEAMATGCYPIATDIPANQQWITHKENGLLYTPGDSIALYEAIHTALLNQVSWFEVKTKNLEMIRSKANWIINTQKMLGLYELVITDSNSNK